MNIAYKSRGNLVLTFWRCLTYQKVPRIKFANLVFTTITWVNFPRNLSLEDDFYFMFCFNFLFNIKPMEKFIEKKFPELEKNPKLNTRKPNYYDLHFDRVNVFIESFAINLYSSSYENFHQNGLVVKLFYSREQNEHVIAFFYKMR